jgi:hypothetical protein
MDQKVETLRLASEIVHELSLPFGFSFRLERAETARVEGLISTCGTL